MQATATPVAAKTPSHPPGLYLLFFTEMWERFSYYGMRGLLILFLTKTIMQGGMGFSDGSAGIIYGWFTGFVYLTPIIGGYLADHFLGQRRAILIGGILMALGQFALAGGIELTGLLDFARSSPGEGGFFAELGRAFAAIAGLPGLLLLILGNGFFKPNISTLVGQLYAQGDPRRDSAFTIFYMGINLGAFLAPLVCGYFAESLFAKTEGEAILHYGFRYGFLAAGCGMVLGQILFNLLSPRYLGQIGVIPTAKIKEIGQTEDSEHRPLTKEEKDRMSVIFIVCIFVTFFWAGFEQAGSSLSLYTDRFIDRTLFGTLIPTSAFQSVNAFFIVALGGVAASIWLALAKKGKDLSVPVKMGLGMILLGIGFLFMVGAAFYRGGDIADESIKAPMIFLVATYFFHTVGELCLSPIGLSMITRLAPMKYASMLMGVWFLSPFVAQVVGGYIAAYVEKLGALAIFEYIALFVIVAGLVFISMNKMLVRMMHGRG
jgi:POT family proton-dependent oligopeptide transporter